MTDVERLSLGLLLLRISLGWFLLYAAVRHTQNAAAWTRTKKECEYFFTGLPTATQRNLSGLTALIGMAMMYGGGSSILLGIEPRLGGLAIAVFCVLGLHIHNAHRKEAFTAMRNGDAMALQAFMGFSALRLKNWILAAVGILFFLAGAGKYAVGIDQTGHFFGW